MSWMMFEDQNNEIADFFGAYGALSDFYEYILCVLYPLMMRGLGFDGRKELCVSRKVPWGFCGRCEHSPELLFQSCLITFAIKKHCWDNEEGKIYSD